VTITDHRSGLFYMYFHTLNYLMILLICRLFSDSNTKYFYNVSTCHNITGERQKQT